MRPAGNTFWFALKVPRSGSVWPPSSRREETRKVPTHEHGCVAVVGLPRDVGDEDAGRGRQGV